MNLDQAEQWANNWATDTTSLHTPLTPLMAEYHRRGQELERLNVLLEATADITQNLDHTTHEMGASLNRLTAALQPEANQ